MAFGGFLKQSTAVDVLIGPFVDDSDGKTAETGLTLSQADIKLSKNGQALAQKNDATAASHDSDGYYNCELDATDTGTLGILVLIVHESGALPVRHEFQVVTANVWDTLCSTDQLDVNVTNIKGADPTDQIRDAIVDDATQIDASALNALSGVTNISSLAIDGDGHVEADVVEIEGGDPSDAINAACDDSIETYHLDHLLAATLDPASKPGVADALLNELIENDSGVSRFTENALEQGPTGGGDSAATIADAVWDEALSGHTDAGSAGEAAGRLDDIQTDTEDLQAQIGTGGDGLDSIPWNSAWDAEVQSECADALNAYDPPTKAELDSGLAGLNDPTAAAIADAVWDETSTGHVDAGKAGAQLFTDIDAILADTNELQSDDIPGTLSTMDGKLDTIDGIVDDIVADTNELQTDDVPGTLSTIEGKIDTVDGIVDSILEDTNELQTDDVPGLIGALNDFDPASDQVTVQTNNDKTGYALSAAAIDAIIDETLTDLSDNALNAGETITLRKAVRAIFNRFFREVTQTDSAQVVKNDDGDQVASMTVSDDGTTQTKGKAT